ncbi:hypothetical protein ARTHRO9AX_20077 [Arthrobacter sp. 9AX]|uniref:hypothetical protein n=1 Tax=Arthrobacter sp. 9AX TaxID=2653131 RepID=UPI0012F3A723|nr:hypothetical protein [Arthrobacter sp. 9AX]VXB85485.1 hypothetical protein ARTHRO9AX_20077 [Arthrobacter sp. 9AX]
MHKAGPLSEPAPGEALQLDTSGFSLRDVSVDAPPAKMPVRHHQTTVIEGRIMITESTDVPNVPHGGWAAKSKRQPVNPNQRTCSWL